MALKDILADIAADGGIDLTNADQLLYTTKKINTAAKEIYEQNDLVGSLREQVYNVNVPQGNLISLYHYVGHVRATRYFSPQLNLKVRSMAPRYTARFWQSKDFLSWEVKGDRATLADITNASVLAITFQAPVDVDTNVTIIGSTNTAARCIETIAFQEGDTVHSTFNSFRTIDAITKDQITASNAVITDIDQKVVSLLANDQFKALFKWIQVINLPNNLNGGVSYFQPATTFCEVLWKLRFREFKYPQTIDDATDEFMCPEYDQAIYWKYKENRLLLSSDATIFSANQAKGFKEKCDGIIKNVAQNASQSMEMSMNFGENATIEAFTNIMLNRFSGGYPNENITGFSNLVWP